MCCVVDSGGGCPPHCCNISAVAGWRSAAACTANCSALLLILPHTFLFSYLSCLHCTTLYSQTSRIHLTDTCNPPTVPTSVMDWEKIFNDSMIHSINDKKSKKSGFKDAIVFGNSVKTNGQMVV